MGFPPPTIHTLHACTKEAREHRAGWGAHSHTGGGGTRGGTQQASSLRLLARYLGHELRRWVLWRLYTMPAASRVRGLPFLCFSPGCEFTVIPRRCPRESGALYGPNFSRVAAPARYDEDTTNTGEDLAVPQQCALSVVVQDTHSKRLAVTTNESCRSLPRAHQSSYSSLAVAQHWLQPCPNHTGR